jgi:hypothetical protein
MYQNMIRHDIRILNYLNKFYNISVNERNVSFAKGMRIQIYKYMKIRGYVK